MGRFSTDAGNGDFVQAPAGSHVARCIRIVDLGTQTSEYQGKETHKSQVLISWELCHEMMEIEGEQKPFIVSKFFTNSLNENANLRAALMSWRGRDFTEDELKKFDLQSILGAPCILSVVHSEKGKAKVEGVLKLTKGTEAPAPQNTPYAFWLDEFSQNVFDGISDGIKSIIKKSPEYQALLHPNLDSEPTGTVDPFDDDLAF